MGYYTTRFFFFVIALFYSIFIPLGLFFKPQLLLSKANLLKLNIKIQQSSRYHTIPHMVLSSHSTHYYLRLLHVFCCYGQKWVNLAYVKIKDPSSQMHASHSAKRLPTLLLLKTELEKKSCIPLNLQPKNLIEKLYTKFS